MTWLYQNYDFEKNIKISDLATTEQKVARWKINLIYADIQIKVKVNGIGRCKEYISTKKYDRFWKFKINTKYIEGFVDELSKKGIC